MGRVSGAVQYLVHRLPRPFCNGSLWWLFTHTAPMALMSKMHWTELLRQEHLSLSPHVYQCLANNICLKEHLRTEHQFSKTRPTTWCIHSPGTPSPKGWATGSLRPGRPMGFTSLVQMRYSFWLLRQSAGEHSSFSNLIAFQTVWCPSEHSISSSCSLHSCD